MANERTVLVYDKVTKKPVYQSYTVKEIGGLRIGLAGIASNIIDKTMPPSYSEGIYLHLAKKNSRQLSICFVLRRRLT